METSSAAASLASSAAERLIDLLTKDGWAAVKASVVALWRHSRPDQVDADLDEAQSDLLHADEGGGGPQARRLLEAEWQARLARLFATRPDAVVEVRALMGGELGGADRAGQQTASSMTLKARVSGGGDAFQAGRDMRITKGGQA